MDYLYVFYSPVYGIDNFWETLESSPEREGPNGEKTLERFVTYFKNLSPLCADRAHIYQCELNSQ